MLSLPNISHLIINEERGTDYVWYLLFSDIVSAINQMAVTNIFDYEAGIGSGLTSTNKFTYLGGKAKISVSGSGYTASTGAFRGMQCLIRDKDDTTTIQTLGNVGIYMDTTNHTSFVPRDFIVDDLIFGTEYKIRLEPLANTTIDSDDYINVTVTQYGNTS